MNLSLDNQASVLCETNRGTLFSGLVRPSTAIGDASKRKRLTFLQSGVQIDRPDVRSDVTIDTRV